mgnify:FL=1|jgi:hypothetical protein|tara:strand:- start:318 stop:464 length:147 start_codon:yes stop_codon:yes gene_type:complete
MKDLNAYEKEIANSQSTKRFFEGIERAIKHDIANGMTREESIARLIKK